MKKADYWEKKYLSFGVIVFLMLFMAACTPGNGPTGASDPKTPWLVTATADTWLNTNPYASKHDGGWVYSAREDVLYAMYGNDSGAAPDVAAPAPAVVSDDDDDDGRTLYRIDHIGNTYTVVATFDAYLHGSQPVIDSEGTYVYLPPVYSGDYFQRYDTVDGDVETLANAPSYAASYQHGAWKNGKLWLVFDNGTLYSYDPAANIWSSVLYTFSNNANVASSGPSSNLIYIIVRNNPGLLYSYDTTNGTVTSLANDPYGFDLGGNGQFTWFGANVGYLYAVGGCSGTPAIYDIGTDTWYSMSDPKPNSGCSGHATYDSKRSRLYVTGPSNDIWYYQF